MDKPVPDTPLARKLGIAGATDLKVTGQTYTRSQDWEFKPGMN